jgi:hypothetical protein
MDSSPIALVHIAASSAAACDTKIAVANPNDGTMEISSLNERMPAVPMQMEL